MLLARGTVSMEAVRDVIRAQIERTIYELVTWLPSVWLLLAYVREQPSARTAVLTIVFGIWATGNLSVIGEGTSMIVLPGLVGALGLAWVTMRGWRLRAR